MPHQEGAGPTSPFWTSTGYRTLSAGQAVRLKAESPGQDGFSWRAVHVSVDGKAPATLADTGAGGAYTASLTITWDDGE